MRKKRLIVFLLVAVFASLLLAGCQAEETTESQETSQEQTQAESQDVQTEASAATTETENAIYGNVTAIDGTSITLELGTLNEDMQTRGGQDGGEGQPPSGEGQDGEEPAEMPSDMPSPEDQPSDMPSGEQPSDLPSDGETPSMLTLTGETITITVDDESIIASFSDEDGETGLSAIEVGSTLKVVYADDGETVESITVMGGGMNGFSGDKPGDADGETPPSASSSS